MNLVIDAGNTLIKNAVYNSAGLVMVESHSAWLPDWIHSVIERFPAICSALICSTREIPGWLPEFMESRNIVYQELSHTMELPITIGYESPGTLG